VSQNIFNAVSSANWFATNTNQTIANYKAAIDLSVVGLSTLVSTNMLTAINAVNALSTIVSTTVQTLSLSVKTLSDSVNLIVNTQTPVVRTAPGTTALGELSKRYGIFVTAADTPNGSIIFAGANDVVQFLSSGYTPGYTITLTNYGGAVYTPATTWVSGTSTLPNLFYTLPTTGLSNRVSIAAGKTAQFTYIGTSTQPWVVTFNI
jgi:hypothetical protein